jgi:hypothetical protein
MGRNRRSAMCLKLRGVAAACERRRASTRTSLFSFTIPD